jgi:hypothetical protein
MVSAAAVFDAGFLPSSRSYLVVKHAHCLAKQEASSSFYQSSHGVIVMHVYVMQRRRGVMLVFVRQAGRCCRILVVLPWLLC